VFQPSKRVQGCWCSPPLWRRPVGSRGLLATWLGEVSASSKPSPGRLRRALASAATGPPTVASRPGRRRSRSLMQQASGYSFAASKIRRTVPASAAGDEIGRFLPPRHPLVDALNAGGGEGGLKEVVRAESDEAVLLNAPASRPGGRTTPCRTSALRVSAG
jgi:hypothetical protein